MDPDMPVFPLASFPVSALKGNVKIPGDKSISHRAIILGLLANGETTITGLLESGDVLNSLNAASALGALVHKSGEQWTIKGAGNGALLEPKNALDFGNSGTGCRLFMGLLGTYDFISSFVGDSSLSSRPMNRVLDPMLLFGTRILSQGKDGRLPIVIHGPEFATPIEYHTPVASAQVKSAILLAGLNASGVTTVIEPVATRDHTEKMLHGFGVPIDIVPDDSGGKKISIEGQHPLSGCNITVPGDPSSAAFLIVAGLITPDSEITIYNVLMNQTRTGLIATLLEMGGYIEIANKRIGGGEEIADIIVRHSELNGVTVSGRQAASMIDEYPILAVAAAFAQGRTTMLGIGELRVKESDRLKVIADGLRINGVIVDEGRDFLIVRGEAKRKPPGGGKVKTKLDHRVAMSFLVMGMACQKPVMVDDGNVIATSFPQFSNIMNGLGARIENISND